MTRRNITTKPFVSQQQAKFAFATGQSWARRWAHETPGGIKNLPRKVRSKRSGRKYGVENKEAGIVSAIPSIGNASGPGGLFSSSALEGGRERPRIKKKSGAEGHTSAMLALYLPAERAAELAQYGRDFFGISAEKADDLHVTLCYLGKVTDIIEYIPRMVAGIQGYATAYLNAMEAPLEATLGPLGSFPTVQEDGTLPIYYQVESPSIREFTAGLESVLQIVGVPYTREFEVFNPHVTIAYRPSDQVPQMAGPIVTALFDTLTIALGDLHIDLPIAPPIAKYKETGEIEYKSEQIAPGVYRIQGNLCQVHGKFGPCSSASESGFSSKPKKPKGGKGKGGGGGKGKPKVSPEQHAAAREEQKKAAIAQNRTNTLAALSTRPNDEAMAAMDQLKAGGQGNPAVLDGLAAEGLVEKHRDGAYTLTAAGHKFQNALDKGDAGAAQEAISGGHDQVAKVGDANAARAQHEAERAKVHQEIVERRAARQAALDERKKNKPQSSGGGGGGGKDRQVELDKAEEQLNQLKTRLQELMAQFRPKKTPTPEEQSAATPVAFPQPSVAVPTKKRPSGEPGDVLRKGKNRGSIAHKEQGEAPGYGVAASPGTSCAACEEFQLHRCTLYDFAAKPHYTCDSWHSRVLTIALAATGGQNPSTLKSLDDDSGVLVFKQANGQWRWVLYSSDAFEDRDKEVVTRKALENDVARTDRDGDYGPLRWWHVGSPKWVNPLDWRTVVAGPGLDIGVCDFSGMSGPVLIESGTFNTPEIGAAIALKAKDLQSSLGFSHPIGEPDGDGLYHNIKRFERSLTPKLKASNPRTHLIVAKEAKAVDNQQKLAAFKALVGDDVADVAIGAAASTTKEARTAGIREKAQEAPEVDWIGSGQDELADIQAQIAALQTQMGTMKAKIQDPEEDKDLVTNAEEEGAPEVQIASTTSKARDHEEPDGDGDAMGNEPPGEEEIYVGDMTSQEFVAMLQQAFAPLFDGVHKSIDLHTNMKNMHQSMADMKNYLGGMVNKDSALAELRESVITLKAELEAAQAKLDEMTGTLPRVASRPQRAAYKASLDDDNVLSPQSSYYQQPIGEEAGTPQGSPLSWLDSFVVSQQATAQGATQPAIVVPQR